MRKQFLSRHKLVIACAIPCLLCTVWFLLDPCLNLSYIVALYHEENPEYLRSLSRCFSLLAYLLSLSTIILACFMTFRFGIRTLGRWLIGTVIIFMSLPEFTEFPFVGQLSLIWAKNNISLSWDIHRYSWLIDWLIAWIITLSIYIVILTILEKARRKQSHFAEQNEE